MNIRNVREPFDLVYEQYVGRLPELVYSKYEKDFEDAYSLWQRAFLVSMCVDVSFVCIGLCWCMLVCIEQMQSCPVLF